MKTYQVDLTSSGIGLKGLVLFTIAVILQTVVYVVFGLICFFVGLIMFLVGGYFGRSVQKHYDTGSSKDLVGVPIYQYGIIWYWKLFASVFPMFWFMAGVWSHGFMRIACFSALHLTGGEF